MCFAKAIKYRQSQVQMETPNRQELILNTQIHLIKQYKSDFPDTLAVAFVGVDTEALDSPEEDHAAEEDNLVDIGLPFDQEGVLRKQIIRLVRDWTLTSNSKKEISDW